MSKFTNTTYTDVLNNLVTSIGNKINNPYYKFNDKKPTPVTYYKQNKEMSTLDEASKLNYEHVGRQSPIYFNKINGFLLYGLERINVDYDVGEYGLEAAPISGTAIELPNTIQSLEGDFFVIDYLSEKGLLFKVNKVTPDTLDTGANIYQLDYQLEFTQSIEQIEAQVVKTYNFIANNIGTDFKTILTDTETQLVGQLEVVIEELISYYEALFFKDKLQTFIYLHKGYHIYDPYLIEFLINNNILNFGEKYIYVSHATPPGVMFPIEYTKTLFYQLENKDLTTEFESVVTADMITDPNSLFVTRIEDYYRIRYNDNFPFKTRFEFLNQNLVNGIRSRTYVTGELEDLYNFIISYFNNEVDTRIADIITTLKLLDYSSVDEAFYLIPIILFILQKYIRSLMS